jgi:dethiobiotin synthetase
MAGFFVTGTDTGVGKTWAATVLMRLLRDEGLTALGMKPVASGCRRENGGLRNEDALRLQEESSFPLSYEEVNPYALEWPVSPHIAARRDGRDIALDPIVERCRALEARADRVVVEGVGGWEAPLNERERVSDLARALGLPVILVVGLRLGCLNHAFLTHAAMERSGVDCLGWIANELETEFLCLEENLETLRAGLPSPFLGIIRRGGRLLAERYGNDAPALRGREEILRRLPLSVKFRQFERVRLNFL